MAIRNFQELIEAAKQYGSKRIVVPMGHDPDVIEGLFLAREHGLAEGILLGDSDGIKRLCDSLNVDVKIFDVQEETNTDTAILRSIRMLHEGKADLIMKGKTTTSEILCAVLNRENKLRTGRSISQVVLFRIPWSERMILFSDAAINILPDLERKADICRNCIDVAHAIGIDHPNVAVLTALEQVNPAMPATVDAAALVQMNRRHQITGAYLEGPIALDAPLSRFAAERKGIESPLVENTDILIFPNIEAANIFYRSVVYLAGAESGGLVYGSKVPIILLSRAETPEVKLNSIALSVLVAEYQRKHVQL